MKTAIDYMFERKYITASLLFAAIVLIVDLFSESMPVSVLVSILVIFLGAILETSRRTHDETGRHTDALKGVHGLVTAQQDPVLKTKKNVDFLKSVNAKVNSYNYENQSEFFLALVDALEKTRAEVRMTQIRDQDPKSQGTEAEDWASAIAAWSGEDNHTARRVLSLQSEEMIDWAKEQLAATAIGGAHFKMRAIQGERGIPAINFALFDRQAVFIVLTTQDAMQFSGIGIESEEVGEYFAEYFDLLWYRATPLESALVKLDRSTALTDLTEKAVASTVPPG